MIGDSGLSVNTAEANKKCILDFTIIYKKKKITPENYPFAKSQGQLKLFFYISDNTDIQALAVCSEPCFSERLFKQELGKTCKNRFQQEVIGKKYIYVRSMIIFSTLILHKNKKRQWGFWFQSMKPFYLQTKI